MKKALAFLLTLVMCFSMTSFVSADAVEVGEDVVIELETMTHADYVEAEIDSEVVIDAYVQAKQGWWDGKVTVYAADEDGAYFIYNMECTEEENELLVPGTHILVFGYKSEWSGEVEIVDAAYMIMDGAYLAEAVDVTELLGTEELVNYQNQYVTFTEMTVAPSKDADGNDVAFLYKWDGSGEDGDDLYFNVALGEDVYTFTVESYLTGAGTEVYETVKSLEIGDVINMNGFLYWYNGVNPHITSVKVGAMTYAQYAAAELDSEVVIETYVQAKQGWWEDKVTVYTQDADGAYFLYNMPCTQEQDELLVPGTKIRVTGYKSEWSGEVEIVDAAFEIIEDAEPYVAEAVDVTELLGTDELIKMQNRLVAFSGLTIMPSKDAEGNDVAFLYKWDGSGSEGDDLYFNVSLDGEEVFQFTVESYLCGSDTEVYQAVQALEIGAYVDMEGFLYWYNGVNPHITAVCAAEGDPFACYAPVGE